MHTIERTDRFTLLGADARRFSSRSSTRKGRASRARSGRDVRVNEGEEASHDVGEGLTLTSSRRRRRSTTTSTMSRCTRATPRQLRASTSPRLQRGRAARRHPARRARRCVPRVPRRRSDRAGATAPESRRGARRPSGRCEGAARGGGRRRRRTEHVRRVRVGPGAREDRVRRAQADVLTRVVDRDRRRRDGRPRGSGTRAAARRGRDGDEKGDRAGGSMLLSSCVVWRHLRFDDFREDCPHGDERLQRLIWERLDDRSPGSSRRPACVRCGRTPRTRGRPAGATTPAGSPRPCRGRRARSGCESLSISRAARPRNGWFSGARRARAGTARPLEPLERGRRADRRRSRWRRDGGRSGRAPRARHAALLVRIEESDYVRLHSPTVGGCASPTSAARSLRNRPRGRERSGAGDRSTARRDGVVRAGRSESPEGASCPRGGRRGRRDGTVACACTSRPVSRTRWAGFASTSALASSARTARQSMGSSLAASGVS